MTPQRSALHVGHLLPLLLLGLAPLRAADVPSEPTGSEWPDLVRTRPDRGDRRVPPHRRRADPPHRGSHPHTPGASALLPRSRPLWKLDAQLRFVDRMEDIPAYLEADIRLALALGGGLEQALVGQNLLHDKHAEFRQAASSAHASVPRGFHA